MRDRAPQFGLQRNRSIDCALISPLKKRKPFLPSSLARYIAMSAFLVSVAASAPFSG